MVTLIGRGFGLAVAAAVKKVRDHASTASTARGKERERERERERESGKEDFFLDAADSGRAEKLILMKLKMAAAVIAI
jgi:hypothetical protein